MTAKSFIQCERKRLEKMKKYQLPNTFKKVGVALLFISITLLLVFVLNSSSLESKLTAKYGILAGLLVISISKEKIEDELITDLRMQSYTFAFIIGVIITLTNPLFSYLANFIFEKQQNSFSGLGDWQILWLLLSIQVFYFQFLKRLHK